jgi:hypothetical protein
MKTPNAESFFSTINGKVTHRFISIAAGGKRTADTVIAACMCAPLSIAGEYFGFLKAFSRISVVRKKLKRHLKKARSAIVVSLKIPALPQ